MLLTCHLLFLSSLSAVAQRGWQLVVDLPPNLSESVKDLLPAEKYYADTLSLRNALQQSRFQMQGAAYLEASFDRLTRCDSVYTTTLHLGSAYEWAALKNGNVNPAFLEQIGFRERLYRQRKFSLQEVQQLQASLLDYVENNGYPFAVVWLDSISVIDQQFSASLMMRMGPPINFEKVEINGEVKISSRYLENYLGIRPGTPYSQEKILKIRDRLRELPFLQEKRGPIVTFTGRKATVNVYLE
ncbi:MAG: POTRA domain-containing protein, partial [Bacteroidota bacterium]